MGLIRIKQGESHSSLVPIQLDVGVQSGALLRSGKAKPKPGTSRVEPQDGFCFF